MISAVDVTGADANATYTFSVGSAANKLVLSNGTSSQEITVADTAAASQTMSFSDFGVSVTITGTKLAANTVTEMAGKTVVTDTLAVGVENAEFAIGANGTAAEKMTVKFEKVDSTTLGTGVVGAGTKLTALLSGTAGTVVDTAAKADALTASIDDAISQVSEQRSKLGAAQNRLEHTIKNLDNTAENLQAAESRVRDVDMAKGNDGIHQEQHPATGCDIHAGTSQPGSAGGSLIAQIRLSHWFWKGRAIPALPNYKIALYIYQMIHQYIYCDLSTEQ